MAVVRMPDGALVDMPDNPTPEQLAALRQVNYYSQPSVDGGKAAEAGRVADQTVRGGLFATPNMVKGLYKAAEDAAVKRAEGTGGIPTSPMDAIMTLAAKARPEWLEKAYDLVATPNKPQTPTGKLIGGVGEGAVAALTGPGALAKPVANAAIGAGAGGGSEGAAQLFGDNAMTRLLGGLAGGGLAALPTALTPTAESLTKRAVSGVSEGDWRRAKQLEATLESEGMPHLKSQLLGPASSLDDVVRDASANPAVRPQLLAATRNVAPQADKALNLWMLKNLPISVDERRVLMQGLQNEAAGVIQAAKGRANQAYGNALTPMQSSEAYPKDHVMALADRLRQLADDPDKFGPLSGGPFINKLAGELAPTRSSPILGTNGKPMEVAEPIVTKGYINNLLKSLNTKAEAEGYKGLPLEEVKRVLRDFTSDFDAARQAKSAYMATNVNPMQQGLTGVIAQQGGGPRADKYTAVRDTVGLVFPSDKAQPLAIRQLASDLGGDTVGHLLSEHLSRNMQQAAKSLSNQEATPAKFVESVVGTQAARQNIESAIMETAKSSGVNPFAARNGFYDLMQAFASYKDLKLSPSVDLASTRFEAGKSVAGAVVAPQSRVARYIWERTTAKTYQKIADMVTSKDGLAKLEAIARRKDPAYTQSVLLGTLAGAEGGDTQQ